MAHFEDVSDYAYAPGFVHPGMKAVGWLARNHVFPTMTPDEETLDLLWLYCSISVAQTRGIHQCEFCSDRDANICTRHSQRLKLGTAEIRVFSKEGIIYAAPNLVFHYISVHHYRPPEEFLQALWEGPRPPSDEYFNALVKLNLEWVKTPKGPPKDRILLRPDTPDGKNYLTKIGTLQDIASIALKLEEGLIVHFYCYEVDEKNPPFLNEDPLFFEGTVHFDPEKKQWYILIDQNSYRHESSLS